jgi:S1-C subfamily serine protease
MTEEAKGLALPQLSASLARLVEGVSKSVVEIGSGRRALASGFIWRPELVVTAEEPLGDYESATVAVDGHKFEAAIVGRDPSADVAVLRVSGLGGPALPLAAGFTPKTGEIVLSAAHHDGSIVARLGIVSMMGGPWLSMRGGQIDSLIRLDVTLDRWGEGGPVIDSEGRAFGMAVRGHRRSVLAIPAATIERVAARILEKGSAKPGYLGLGLHPVRLHGATATGLMVLGVAPGSPGERAGVLQGDIITAWDGEPVAGTRDVLRRLGPDTEGQTVELTLSRVEQPFTVKCVIGARPRS